jgi:hypothetical protein
MHSVPDLVLGSSANDVMPLKSEQLLSVKVAIHHHTVLVVDQDARRNAVEEGARECGALEPVRQSTFDFDFSHVCLTSVVRRLRVPEENFGHDVIPHVDIRASSEEDSRSRRLRRLSVLEGDGNLLTS